MLEIVYINYRYLNLSLAGGEIFMSRSCSQCGSEIFSHYKFCNKCGYNLTERRIDNKRTETTVTENANTASTNTKVEYPPNVYVPDRGLWQKFFRISGRLNPMRFLFRTTIIFTADFLILLILAMMHVSVETGNTVAGAVMFVSAILMIPLMIRRSHDLGRPAWYFIVACVPLVVGVFELLFRKVWWFDRDGDYHDEYRFNEFGAVAAYFYIIIVSVLSALYFTFCPGNKGTNEYGPNPAGMTVDIPVEDNKILAAISKVEEHEYSTFAIILVVAMLTFGTTTIGQYMSQSNALNPGLAATNVPVNHKPQSQNVSEMPNQQPEKQIVITPLTNDNQRAAVNTLVSFHRNITQKNFRSAYNCLSDGFQSEMNYDGWASGFGTTVSSSVDNISVAAETQYEITLNYILTAVDKVNGQQKIARFNGTVILVYEGGEWRIDYINNKVA